MVYFFCHACKVKYDARVHRQFCPECKVVARHYKPGKDGQPLPVSDDDFDISPKEPASPEIVRDPDIIAKQIAYITITGSLPDN